MKWKSCIIVQLLLFLAVGLTAQEQIPFTEFPLGVEYRRGLGLKIRDTAEIGGLIRSNRKLYKRFPDSALHGFRKALKWSVNARYPDGVAMALLNIGAYHANKGLYQEALRYYKYALPYCRSAIQKREQLLLNYFINMTVPYSFQGKNDSAILFYISAVETAKRIKDSSALMHVYANLSGFYVNTGLHDKAIIYAKEGERISMLISDSSRHPQLYCNLTAAYGGKKEWDSLLHYGELALSRARMLKDLRHGSSALSHLGTYYLTQKEPVNAIQHFQEMLVTEGDQSHFRLLDAYKGLGRAYYDLQQDKRALSYTLRALEIAKSSNVRNSILTSIWFDLARIYNRMGNYKEAIDYLGPYAELKDSLMSVERNKSVDLLEAQYQAAEKNKKIAEHQVLLKTKEIEIQKKNLWILGVSLGALLISVSSVSLYRYSKHKQKLQSQEMYTLQQEQEISNLKSMIRGEEKERTRLARELHDGIMVQLSSVKMNLNSLPPAFNDLQELPQFQQTVQQLDQATIELRRTAHNLMPDMLLEGGIGEAVFYFCKNLQQNSGLKIAFQMQEALPRLQQEFELSTYRIIQELVQNIIKHANASKAIVQLICRDDHLFITVTDNGGGFTEASLDSAKSGMGLKSIRTRVRALNGTMEIVSNPTDGTAVYLEFDIRTVLLKQNMYESQSQPDSSL